MGQVYPTPFWRETSFKGWHWFVAVLMTAIGGGMCYVTTLPVMVDWWDMRAWIAVPCERVELDIRRVDRRRGGDDFAVVGSYVYTHQGVRRTGSRIELKGPVFESRDNAEAAFRRLGESTVAWIDPADPSESVLSKGWNRTATKQLVPIGFLLFGLGIFLTAYLTGRRRPSEEFRWVAGPERIAETVWAWTLFGLTFFIAVPLTFGVDHPSARGFLTVFAVAASGACIAALFLAIRRTIKLGNPKLEITVTPGQLTAGEPAALEVRVLGDPSLLRDWTLALVVRREAYVKSGKSRRVDVEELHRVMIATSATAPAEDALLIKVPADVWPRYAIDDTEHFCILEAKARINRWPDLHDEVRLDVKAPASG
ncbi:MAG: DUF3592 domain-containing protein [Planctomycetota bacterium]